LWRATSRSRRSLSPAEANDIGKLDPEAIEAVKKEAWPEATSADELHDALLLSGFITQHEGIENHWEAYFHELVSAGRATALTGGQVLWVATERVPYVAAIHSERTFQHAVAVPEKIRQVPADKDPLAELIRGRLEIMGPVTAGTLASLAGLTTGAIDLALLRLENEGFVFRGNFSGPGTNEWCERRLLARIHRYTIKKLRSEIQPVSAADYMRFLFSWHQLEQGKQSQGPVALEHALQKLEGYEAPAVAWEADILPARIDAYDHQWLDMLSIAGKISWGRFRIASNAHKEKKASSPIRTRP
jgi:ATP-dependent helicase Lhr and Lhr-like helicase